ncbi:MAG: hypothetical protein U5L09_12495 [Bacteroidales bacterium]|nr:hypothetical protein [Bacteroidales bacterium]
MGLYGELSWDYSTLGSDNVGWLGARAGLVINHRWVIGVTGKHWHTTSTSLSWLLKGNIAWKADIQGCL